MTPRRLAGLLLALWWVVYPLVLRLPVPLGTAHGLLVAALAGCAAATAARSARLPLGPPVWATLLAVASLLVATFRAPERFSVDERWEHAVVGLSHALFFVCALVLVPRRAPVGSPRAVVEDLTAERMRRGLAAALGLAALAQALVVFLAQDGVARVEGTFGNPNFFGAFVAAVGLTVGALAAWQPAVVAALAVFGAVLLQTGSRGAFVAGAGVLLMYLARRRTRIAFGVALLAAVILWTVPNPLTARVAALDDHLSYGRPFLWATGLTNALEHPLGIGAGMNKYVFPASALDAARPWLVHQRHAVGLTHNVFLTLALEWGWLAAGACLALLAWTALHALRPGPGRLGEDRLGLGAGLGAAVLLVEAQVDGLEQNPLLFSLFLLLVAVVINRVGRPQPALLVSGRALAVVLAAAGLALALAVGLEQRERAAGHRAEQTLRAWRADAVDTDAARAVIAADASAHPGDVHLTRTRLEFEVAVLREELPATTGLVDPAAAARVWDALEAARAANPADPRPLREAARASLAVFRRGGRRLADFERYVTHVRTLLALDPYAVPMRRELALEAHGYERPTLVDAQLAALLALEPDSAFCWWMRALRAEAEQRDVDALRAYDRAREAIFAARRPEGARRPGARAAVDALLELTSVEQIDARRRELVARLRLRGLLEEARPHADPAESARPDEVRAEPAPAAPGGGRPAGTVRGPAPAGD